MTITQISIFLENKCGKLSQVLGILTQANIRIIAATVADTSEYGILRLIVTDPDKAYKLFKESNVAVSKTEVLALATDSCAGSFAKVLGYFTEARISVEYIYCFSLDGKSILILRTNNSSEAYDVVKKHNLEYILSENLNKI